MKKVADEIPAYTYGTPAVTPSPVTLGELEKLKVSAGFTEEDWAAKVYRTDIAGNEQRLYKRPGYTM